MVAAIVRRVVDDYRPTLDGFERDVMEAEHEVFADRAESRWSGSTN